ncbi:MAG: hypothetical protein DIU56_008200 [Pseudomonadota bacterium]|jgi:hypothetical protein|nr:MAG: hypothetical protein DIU56_10725 [Pseudomonadota bacterium]
MRAIASKLLCTGLVAGIAGCAGETPPAPAPFEPVADVKQVMQAITIPASDAVWGVATKEPASDEEWLAIKNNALALAESGNLLLMNGRTIAGRAVGEEEEWRGYAKELIRTAVLAAEAAEARDLERILDAGDEIYNVCESCHQKYMPQPQPPEGTAEQAQ